MVRHLPQEDRDGEAEREREDPRGLSGPRAEAGDGTGLQGRHAEGMLVVCCPAQGRGVVLEVLGLWVGAAAEEELDDDKSPPCCS